MFESIWKHMDSGVNLEFTSGVLQCTRVGEEQTQTHLQESDLSLAFVEEQVGWGTWLEPAGSDWFRDFRIPGYTWGATSYCRWSEDNALALAAGLDEKENVFRCDVFTGHFSDWLRLSGVSQEYNIWRLLHLKMKEATFQSRNIWNIGQMPLDWGEGSQFMGECRRIIWEAQLFSKFIQKQGKKVWKWVVASKIRERNFPRIKIERVL